jgi:DNA transformation protein
MDADAIAEMFSAYGPVAIKRMFSGYGLYSEGVCFALCLRGGEFYFKADETNIPRFEADGCKPFSYSQRRSGKVVTVNSFWRMPDRLYDDPEELADWTKQAVVVAHRVQIAKTSRKTRAVKKAAPKKVAAKKAKSSKRPASARKAAKARRDQRRR